MANRRNKSPTHLAFESNRESGKFTKVCNDMMNSVAWKQLNLRQQGLYLILKSKFTIYRDKTNNADNISLPKAEAQTIYGDLRTFRNDIDTLIELGFIKLVQSGWNTRTVNIYGFSSKWKLYGTSDFKISLTDKRNRKV